MKVLIADDHAIVRDGLKQLLGSQPDMVVVGEAEDGVDALNKAKSLRPDVVLLDIAMPRLSGLEVVRLIKEAVVKVQVVILTMFQKEAYVYQALSAGALGYVLKASRQSDILKALRYAHRGECFLSSKINAEVMASYLESKKSRPTVRGYDLLSEREQQVFRLVVEGNTTGEISGILSICAKTVEKHRSSIMRKLDIHDSVGLVKYAVKIGIADPETWNY